ncbi:hypothetical protein KSS87_020593 [Heliosperma pusillum]|nr:hypothetical protein KSS87_020593 [Heliosperma pusillum]
MTPPRIMNLAEMTDLSWLVHIVFRKCPEYCDRYAKKENIVSSVSEDGSDEEDNSEGQSGSSDDEIAGHADP